MRRLAKLKGCGMGLKAEDVEGRSALEKRNWWKESLYDVGTRAGGVNRWMYISHCACLGPKP